MPTGIEQLAPLYQGGLPLLMDSVGWLGDELPFHKSRPLYQCWLALRMHDLISTLCSSLRLLTAAPSCTLSRLSLTWQTERVRRGGWVQSYSCRLEDSILNFDARDSNGFDFVTRDACSVACKNLRLAAMRIQKVIPPLPSLALLTFLQAFFRWTGR